MESKFSSLCRLGSNLLYHGIMSGIYTFLDLELKIHILNIDNIMNGTHWNVGRQGSLLQ